MDPPKNYRLKLLISVLLIFILPILLVIIALMHLCRLFVKFLAKILQPDLISIVSCSSNSIANLSNTLKNPRLAIVTKTTFQGRIELDDFRKHFSKRLINSKNSRGELKYPELKLVLTSWIGFRFWKNDQNFDITNHINLHEFENKSKITIDDLTNLEAELMVQSFNPEHSPWRCTVVYDDNKNITHLIGTFAHVLCDGYSMIKMNEALSDFETKEEIKPKFIRQTLIEKILLPFKCVYTLSSIIVETLTPYPFKVSKTSSAFVGNVQRADAISTETIKNIKRKYNVSFSAVVFSIAAGAFRKLAIENGIKLTKSIPCMIPVPRPGHPEKPTNHFALAAMNLPIGESDPEKRLKLCDKEFELIRSSAYPLVSYIVMILSGGCFNFIGRILGCPDPALFISYIPSSWTKFTQLGHDLLETTFCYAQSGTVGCSITMVTALDKLIMYVVAEGSVLSKQQVSTFRQIVKDEVNALITYNNNE